MACTHCGRTSFLADVCGDCKTKLSGPLGHWVAHMNAALADRILTPEEEAGLRAYQVQLGIPDADVAPYIPALHRAKTLGQVMAGYLPSIQLQGVFLDRGEVAHYACQSAYCDTVTSKEYVRRSAGSSVRIMKGWTVRSGGSRGHWETHAHAVALPGMLAITSTNIRFVARGSFTFPLRELSAFNYAANGVAFMFGGADAKGYFSVADGEYVAAMAFAAKQRLDNPPPERVSVEVLSYREAARLPPASRRRAEVTRGMTEGELVAAFGEPDAVAERATKTSMRKTYKFFPEGRKHLLKVQIEDDVVVGWTDDR